MRPPCRRPIAWWTLNTSKARAWVHGAAVALVIMTAVALIAQQPMNVLQVGSTAVDTNSGNKSAGTIRVVVATDQPQLTNALKVDGSATTQPVSGTFWQATQPISATSLPLPTLAATSTKQSDGSQKTQIVDGSGNVIGATTNALDINIKSGNPTTMTVTQATATNLNAAVVGTGTAGSAAGGILTVQGVASMTKLLVTPDSVALPANQSVNVAQLAGTTTDTNSGSKSAGTLRVVLATDQPALTNKLLVTPDSVALPANQSVNVSQMNGVTVTMGAGATGTGVQRTNDVASSATGAAPPASAAFVGGLGSGATGGFLIAPTVCDTHKAVSMTSATTTLMVTGVSGRHVRICALHLVTAIANNVAIISGTGATCGTGTAGISGGTTAANGYNFAANGGLTIGSGFGEVMRTVATGDSVCIITSAAGPLAGNIAYAIY